MDKIYRDENEKLTAMSETVFRQIIHPFEPVYRNDSEILILGTFPSVKSREQNFYYGHPRNRFWQVLARIFNEKLPITIPEKKALLYRHRIALWDVISCCDITGSDDSSIKNVTPVDLQRVIKASRIAAVYANGRKAGELYKRYQKHDGALDITVLPSTSPANAAWNLERLVEEWREITIGKYDLPDREQRRQ